MIFKRRERPGMMSRFREFIYPRKGFWRGFGYIGQRVRRLPDTPHRIALGFACGAMASFTPFFTLHFIVAALFAWLLRGNIIAALFGTIVGNPISFPAIASVSLWTGQQVLGHEGEGGDFDAVMHAFGGFAQTLWDAVSSWVGGGGAVDMSGINVFFHEVFLPYLIGGTILGLPASALSYWIVGPVVAAYRARRQREIEARVAQRSAAAEREQQDYALHDGREGDNG